MAPHHLKILVLDYLAGRLTCKEFVELTTDYLEGRMSWSERFRFQLHLGLCLGCRVYLRHMKQTIAALNRLDTAVPPAVQAELLERFKTWKKSRTLSGG
jgi:predicted anti-sigma-YlaC factor YlaD